MFFNILVVGSTIIASCGSNNTDSNKMAKDDNKQKFDSTSIEGDTKFAVAAASGGMMEVQASKLALANSSSSDVKKFAQTMIDDHTKANDELATTAQTKGISLPTSLSNEQQDKYDKLSQKKGTDFDKSYTSLMVGDHKDAIDAFKKEGDNGNDADLKKWAQDKLPTLDHHLMMAKSLDSTMNHSK